MKIKLLAAMMALASTGAMAATIEDTATDAVGTWSDVSASNTFEATTAIRSVCMIKSVPDTATTLTFKDQAPANANFTVDYNSTTAPTYDVEVDSVTGLFTVDGTQVASSGVTVTKGTLSGNGFSVSIATNLNEYQYRASAEAKVTATVTVTCAKDEDSASQS